MTTAELPRLEDRKVNIKAPVAPTAFNDPPVRRISPQQREEVGIDQRLDRMTRALRVLGAGLLLASASSFLVQRWESGNDLLRFGFLLAHSILLVGAALFTGGKLAEGRSARMFLWTNLAMVPVHFAVLGGLVYSQFAWDGGLIDLPAFAVWQAPNALTALLAVAGAFAVVVPSVFVAARVLARKHAKLVTASYAGIASLFLIPVRSADWVGLVAFAGAIMALVLERRVFSKDFSMRTLEGRLVRSVFWLPPLLIAGRTAIFYEPTGMFLGLLVSAAGLCGLSASRSIEFEDGASVCEWAASLVVAFGVGQTVMSLPFADTLGPEALLPSALALFLCSRFVRVSRDGLERVAAFSVSGIGMLALIADPGLATAALVTCLGLFIGATSILMGRIFNLLMGAVVSLSGAGVIYHLAIGFDRMMNWGTLTVLGLALVVAAAYAEKNRDALIAWVKARHRQMTDAAAARQGAPEEDASDEAQLAA